MKLAFILAYKNLIGAGLRTWLNVGILSFTFVIIIVYKGILNGWNEQAVKDSVAWEIGQGHLRINTYSPYDPFSVLDGHAELKDKKKGLIPVLLRQGTIFPDGRMIPAMIKGIDPNQKVLELPTYLLKESKAALPVLIGKRMAESSNLKLGQEVLMRWRDKNGTYDATNITIVGIFDCNVSATDNGQLWMDKNRLYKLSNLKNHATYFINTLEEPIDVEGWTFFSKKQLLEDLSAMMETKKTSSSIMYGLLLTISLLAIFDTQVLSIFRRQKEIGTYIALGMTPQHVVGLFTVEGTQYSILAIIVGLIYGAPICVYLAKIGMGIPEASTEMGVVIADRIYPSYGIGLIFSTILLIIFSATIVSLLPALKITRMNPVNALKGKAQ